MQVPAIAEIDRESGRTLFTLAESHAIMRYLCLTRLPDNDSQWYPKQDPVKRAIIDMYLDEHHCFLRRGCGFYIFKKYYGKGMLGRTFTDQELKPDLELLDRAMRLLESRLT